MDAQLPVTLEATPSAMPMSDAEFDTFLGSAEFQDLLGDPGAASGSGANASMDDALASDFGWGPEKPLDSYLGGADSGRLPSLPTNEVPAPLDARPPTSDPTTLDPILPVADVNQMPGPAPPAETPSRSRTPPLAAASSGGRSAAAAASLTDEGARFADAALNPPPDDGVVRRSVDNGASSSQESVDTGSAQSPCMSWPPQGAMAPHLQRAPHHMPATAAGPAPFGFNAQHGSQSDFGSMQQSAMKSGGGMAFGGGMVGASGQQPQPMWMADGMWQQPMGPNGMAPNGLMPQQQQQQQPFDSSKTFGGGSKSASGMRQGSGMMSGGSGHNSSVSGNSSQFAFQQPRAAEALAQQQQQLQAQQQQQQQPMQGMEMGEMAAPSGAPLQQPMQQQRQPPGDAMQQPPMGMTGMGGMGSMFPGAPHNAYGMRMPPSAAAMFGGMANGGGAPGYGMPPMPGGMVGMPQPPHVGFIAAPPPQMGGMTPGASPRAGGGKAGSQPGTPQSEALVLQELKLLIGQLDPATKSTMKESLYRISRNAQGSTGPKDTGATAAAAAAAARQPGASDAIRPLDRMVADLLYKDPLQQAPDLPSSLAATARAEQQQSQVARQSWPPTGQQEAAAAGATSSRQRGGSRGSRS